MRDKIELAKKLINEKLKDHPKRLKHCYGVAETAKTLAMIYGVNVEKAELVGLFHDYAKYDAIVDQKKVIDPVIVDRFKDQPVIYHAYAAAYYIETLLNVYDKEVIDAIQCHVWGKKHMSLLDKILYVADYCEPNRTFDDRDYIYNLACKNLDESVAYCMQSSIEDVKRKGREPHPDSYEAYQYYMEVTRGITR